MNLNFKAETVTKSGIVPCVAPYINFLNQTDKTQVIKVSGVSFNLDTGDSMSFPHSGINPLVFVNNSFDVVYTAPTNGRELIVTRGYFID